MVELVIVITILAILSTIWFVSFQWYNIGTRDSVRLVDIASIDKWLSIFLAKAKEIPLPDDSISVFASGTLLNYQWYAGVQVMWEIWVFNGGRDPINNMHYTYVLNAAKTKYQLLWFTEREEIYVHNTNTVKAEGLVDMYPLLRWSKLWVLLDPITKTPAQNNNIDIDIVNTTDEYNILINDIHTNITGTGWVLFSNLYILNEDINTNKNIAYLDKSLVLSLDMETTIDVWWTLKLKDQSWFDNHGLCYSDWFVQCGDNVNWLQVIEWKKWKALMFDASISDDYMHHADSDSLNILTNEVTISGWFKLNKSLDNFVDTYPQFLMKRPFNIWWYWSHFTKISWWINMQYCFSWGSKWLNYYWWLPVWEWIHYAGVKSATEFKIYINWKLVESTNLSWNLMWSSTAYPLSIWSRFEWAIDEIKIYNRALNADEILYLSN